MTKPLDTACPWCGEELYHPFTGRDLKSQSEYDQALEAHASEPCDEMAAEMGVGLAVAVQITRSVVV